MAEMSHVRLVPDSWPPAREAVRGKMGKVEKVEFLWLGIVRPR